MEKWKTIKSESLVDSRWVKVRKDSVDLPNGQYIDDFYPITEKPQSEMGGDSDELESGFEFGSFFVPFSEVMRV